MSKLVRRPSFRKVGQTDLKKEASVNKRQMHNGCRDSSIHSSLACAWPTLLKLGCSRTVVCRLWASFTVMRRTYEHRTKARLSFSGGPWQIVWKKWVSGGRGGELRKWHSGNVYCAVCTIFREPSSLKFFWTSIASLKFFWTSIASLPSRKNRTTCILTAISPQTELYWSLSYKN